jgi:putative addiction module component (TIGR02574 family)
MSATDVLKAAKALPLHERIELAQELWHDITEQGYDPELTPAQVAELDRRAEEALRHPEDGVWMGEVRAELRRQHGWK